MVLVADVQIASDLGDGAASGNQIEHFAAEPFGLTLGHGHGSFTGRRDRKIKQTDSMQPRSHHALCYP